MAIDKNGIEVPFTVQKTLSTISVAERNFIMQEIAERQTNQEFAEFNKLPLAEKMNSIYGFQLRLMSSWPHN